MSKTVLTVVGLILCVLAILMVPSPKACTCLSVASLIFFVGDVFHTLREMPRSKPVQALCLIIGWLFYIASAIVAVLVIFPNSELLNACYRWFGKTAEFCSIEKETADSKIPVITVGMTLVYVAIRIKLSELRKA